MKVKNIFWIIIVIFSILIGLYPFSYAFFDMSQALLGLKSKELLSSSIWNVAFYTHIYLGGLSLLIGWSQFVEKFRIKNINMHRRIGKTYIIAVLLSGLSGLYLSFHATGGIIAQSGFGMLSLLWIITTAMGYITIRQKKVEDHENWLIRSYALTLAAVTLRLWMPILGAVFHLDFIEGYRIVAWLCWVPNFIVANILVQPKTASLSEAQ